jgi:hypothetical protein
MSIWASWEAPSDEDHEDGCAIYRETSAGVLDFSGEPCDCGLPRAPLVYPEGHSNRYPDETLGRGGWVDMASIPAHVAYYRANPEAHSTNEPEGWDPNYLRLGVNGKAVVLDRKGVELVHRQLSQWLSGIPGSSL